MNSIVQGYQNGKSITFYWSAYLKKIGITVQNNSYNS